MGDMADMSMMGDPYDYDAPYYSDVVEVYYDELRAETKKAWLLWRSDINHAEWWPKSKCSFDGERFFAPYWLVLRKDFEHHCPL